MTAKTKAISKIGLLFLALAISLSLVGYSAAMWTNGLNDKGLVVTGNIDPVFTKAKATICGQGNVETDIASTDGRTMLINLTDLRPGAEIIIDYTITNRGSVPVRFSGTDPADQDGDEDDHDEHGEHDNEGENGCLIETDCSHQGVTVINKYPDQVINGNNGNDRGKITIRAAKSREKCPPQEDFNFELNMIFSQWNAVETGDIKMVLH